jgi:hypothetical protein
MKRYMYIAIAVVAVILTAYGCYRYGHSKGYADGNRDGYNTGYNTGYHAGYEDKNRLVVASVPDHVTAGTKTETRIVYKTVPYSGADVKVTTPPPTVTVEVNGKKTEVAQKQETADLAVKTETAVKIKVPERRWTFGVGTDGHKATYMLKAPVSGAVGAWVAGGGRDNRVMGGVSVSF